MTERASYTFTVKEHGDGTPFIMLEPNYENLSILRQGFLSFDLPQGTTLEQARAIARQFDHSVMTTAYTPL